MPCRRLSCSWKSDASIRPQPFLKYFWLRKVQQWCVLDSDITLGANSEEPLRRSAVHRRAVGAADKVHAGTSADLSRLPKGYDVANIQRLRRDAREAYTQLVIRTSRDVSSAVKSVPPGEQASG